MQRVHNLVFNRQLSTQYKRSHILDNRRQQVRMADVTRRLGPLCPNCEAISLAALLRAIPVFPERNPGELRGCGFRTSVEYCVPEPLSFPNVSASGESCALCALLFSLKKSKDSAVESDIQLAALVHPIVHYDHDSKVNLRLSTPDHPIGDPFAPFGDPQPQWYGYCEGETRVNSLEPIQGPVYSRKHGTRYTINSPWQINVAADEGSAASRYIPRRPLGVYGPDSFFKGILRAIDNCNVNHTRCRLSVDGSPLREFPELPTRVIDVGDPVRRPRLVISHGVSAKYATLSHCWGGQRWVATTTSSLPQMLDGFDLQEIPKTYADAISVTRRLGIQYLWIDSFCIIQDDRADWAIESQRMGDIYEKAYINIAATGANDGSTGFLDSQRNPIVHVRVPAVAGPEEEIDHFYFTNQPNSDFNTFVTRAKLNTRSWVYQERTLSRRTIHFAADMWYWECGDHIVSEDGWQHDAGGGIELTNSTFHYYEDTTPLRQTLNAAATSIGKVFSARTNLLDGETHPRAREMDYLWACMLRAYSKCNLTFHSDKLPALLGLAQRFQQTTERDYTNGHWLQYGEPLPMSLVWFAAVEGGLDYPNGKPLAPSWSCLKGNGPVDFYDTRSAKPVTMIEQIENFAISLYGRTRSTPIALIPNGEGNVSKPTYYALTSTREAKVGNSTYTFQQTLGPARFDNANDVPSQVTLLLVNQQVETGRWGSMPTKDQLVLILSEVDAADSAESEGSSEEDLETEEETEEDEVPGYYRRIGILNMTNPNFFIDVPVRRLVLV
ncbi:Heterokaryon incompatibility protein (HET) domain containing protein [Naviculisporaceae sp. PSN 640]